MTGLAHSGDGFQAEQANTKMSHTIGLCWKPQNGPNPKAPPFKIEALKPQFKEYIAIIMTLSFFFVRDRTRLEDLPFFNNLICFPKFIKFIKFSKFIKFRGSKFDKLGKFDTLLKKYGIELVSRI